MTLYLDSNATTPIDPRVREVVARCLTDEFGNAGSPHAYGLRAKEAINLAREQVGRVVGARRHEVLFTSGATESNNLAILGLARHGEAVGRRHVVSTQIEHKAVLEPLKELERRGFEVTLAASDASGRVPPEAVLREVRDDTLLVSVMHVNNETGVTQPVAQIASALADADVYFHVDAAQGFGKQSTALQNPGIDLLSVTAHKIYGPQGVGALIARRRENQLPPLTPILHGGGQEFGLRSGTLPTALIAGFGEAARLADEEHQARQEHCLRLRVMLLAALGGLDVTLHGDQAMVVPHVLSASIAGLDSHQVIEALDGVAAVSDGSACTSVCASASHVLAAMGVTGAALDGAVRISWSYLTDEGELAQMLPVLVKRLRKAGASSTQVESNR